VRETVTLQINNLLALRRDHARREAGALQSLPDLAQRKTLPRAGTAAKQREKITRI